MKRKRVKIVARRARFCLQLWRFSDSGHSKHECAPLYAAGLVAAAQSLNNQRVQVDGLILAGSSEWDAANFELTFAVRDREGSESVNVLYANRLKPDNFVDGGSVLLKADTMPRRTSSSPRN